MWQEKYPSEIKAIIGLDWALPESYSQLRMHSQILRMARLGSQLGLLRYIPSRLYVPNENLSSSDRHPLSTNSLSSNTVTSYVK